MSSISIAGDTSGSIALSAPAVAGTTTLTLPSTTGTVLNDATCGVCRAWVNFNGTLTTPITPRASFNVSSVTKSSTATYIVNFTTALSDTNYSAVGSCGGSTGGVTQIQMPDGSGIYSTTQVGVITRNSTGTGADANTINVAVFR